MLDQFQRGFARLVTMYGVLVCIFTLGLWLIPDTWALMAIYATIAHLTLLGAVILLPMAVILSKPRRKVLILLPAVILFLVIYSGQFIPSRTANASDGVSVRVMTYNILFRDGDYDASMAVIRAADADMVAVQELDMMGMQIFQEELSDIYPYMALNGNPNGYVGNGFLSRFPILENVYLQDNLGNQRVVVDVDGTLVVVYNMHASTPRSWTNNLLAFDISDRTSDVNTLLERVSQETERVIVLGDFNLTDLSDSYQTLTHVLVDTYRQVGWGMGWTHAGPLVARRSLFDLRILRIDYIFIKPDGLRSLDAQVWHNSGGSDHLPVLATIELIQTE